MLCPAEYSESLAGIDISELKHRGIYALLVDLDNTLVRWQGYDIPPEVKAWIKEAGEQGVRVCIVSNTRSWKRLEKLAAALDVPFVKRSWKPRRAGFREALKLLNVETEHAAVIGDQILTDILGGNRLELYTILVCPLHPKEFVGTKISRLFEKVVLRLLERRGMLRRNLR
jgi:hypothetical protein